MAWLIDPVITQPHDTTSRITTWHHAMTTTMPRPADVNHPTTGGIKVAMPRIEIGTGTAVIAVDDDTKSMFCSLSGELPLKAQALPD